jgi:tRNA-binding EMAP/Myf-like protein
VLTALHDFTNNDAVEAAGNRLNAVHFEARHGERLLDIVCGAPNCRQGLKVAVATIGAVLPGDFKIKVSVPIGASAGSSIIPL